MDGILHSNRFPAPPIDKTEILRYAGVRIPTNGLDALLESCLSEALDVFSYQVCWRTYPLKADGNDLDLSFAKVHSENLSRHLKGCDRFVLFAATVGIGIDRLVARARALSPSKALLLNAFGVERVEALCDAFEAEIGQQMAKTGIGIQRRFSPGYGDLPLELQRDVIAALDTPRKIGLTLNQSLLLSPSKSVTAIIGIQKRRNP